MGGEADRDGRPRVSGSALAYFYGNDTYGLGQASESVLERLRTESGDVERWRVSGEATTVGRIAERVATGSLFGGGTLVMVQEPASLLRSRDDRDELMGLLSAVAPGNGLVFVESTDGSNRRPATLVALEKAVREAGGETREIRAPKEGQLTNWIEQRAAERGVRLGAGAARELATRIGGFVREGDVDRRGQSQLAVAELDKVGLYRPDGQVTVEDIQQLVAEVVPGSAWAFLDAIGSRRSARALELLDTMLDSTPDLVLLVQIHRRIRELIEVADHLASGATPGSLVRTLGLKPFRAEKLVEQARTWSQEELDQALIALVELDATVRGAPGTPVGDAQKRLAFVLWIGDRVTRSG
jgi:DNA polymerase-3 subunit delta